MSGENTKVYRPQGGDKLVVADGGKIVIETGGVIAGTDGNQAATIAAPTGGTTTDAEARTAITSIIAALKGAGIIAAS